MNTKKMFIAVALSTITTSSFAQNLCVFDPLGTSGDIYSMMKDYALAAKQWGADITLKPYTDELAAAEAFKDSRQCEAVSLTGIRTRQFNNFVGSIDSAGGVLDSAAAKKVIALMANPKFAPDMLDHGSEVAGITTLGLAYVMVNDRSINSILKLAGKRFGVLNYDKAQEIIVTKVGANPVSLELSSIGSQFNTGQVDVLEMPAMAFKPFELNKGMGTKGAIVRFPIAQVTNDVLIHPDKFPVGYGQKSRTWFAEQIDRQMAVVKKVESNIDPRYWMDLSPKVTSGYLKILRESRISLARSGVYNQKMMGILKNNRCSQDPSNYECALKDE
ncbi:MAG: putative multidrug efflux protein AdeT1 [Aquirhabdus sp.]